MKTFLIIGGLALFLIFLVGTYYLLSKISADSPTSSTKSVSRDSIRAHAVNDLATKLSFVAQQETEWPQDWQQIGTGKTDCQIESTHCLITTDNCFDLKKVSQNKFVLPIDVARGSEEQTGYAIRQQGNNLEIIACFAESVDSIEQKIRL